MRACGFRLCACQTLASSDHLHQPEPADRQDNVTMTRDLKHTFKRRRGIESYTSKMLTIYQVLRLSHETAVVSRATAPAAKRRGCGFLLEDTEVATSYHVPYVQARNPTPRPHSRSHACGLETSAFPTLPACPRHDRAVSWVRVALQVDCSTIIRYLSEFAFLDKHYTRPHDASL